MSKRKKSFGISVGKLFGMRSPMVESNEEIVPIKTGHTSVQKDTSFTGVYNEKRAQDGSFGDETKWSVVLKIYSRVEDDFSGTLEYKYDQYGKTKTYKTEVNGRFESFSQGEVEEVRVIEGTGDLKTFMIEAEFEHLSLDVISANLKDKSVVLSGVMTLDQVKSK